MNKADKRGDPVFTGIYHGEEVFVSDRNIEDSNYDEENMNIKDSDNLEDVNQLFLDVELVKLVIASELTNSLDDSVNSEEVILDELHKLGVEGNEEDEVTVSNSFAKDPFSSGISTKISLSVLDIVDVGSEDVTTSSIVV